MVNTYFVIVCLAIFGGFHQIDAKPKQRKLASYIIPCHKSDPKINECLVEHGNDAIKTLIEGDPAHKIRVLNPLNIDNILMTPSPNLKLHFTNVTILGLENLKITEADWTFDKDEVKIKLQLPRAEIQGDYEADGKILILPITGKGLGNMTFENVVFDYTLDYEIEEVDEIKYFKFKDHELSYKAGHVHYDLTNLFNGNKQLGDEMLKFLNENWEEIDKELSSSMIEIVKSLSKEIIVNSVKNVPYEEIFLD